MDEKDGKKPGDLEAFMQNLSSKLTEKSEKREKTADCGHEHSVIGGPIATLNDELRLKLIDARNRLMNLEDEIINAIAKMNVSYIEAVRNKNIVVQEFEGKYGLLGKHYTIDMNTGVVKECVR